MIPIFIGGSGRSGTTVLKRILSAHPSMVSIASELRVIIDPDGALSLRHALTDGWSPYAADHAVWRFRDLLAACASQSPARKVAGRILPAMGISPPGYGASDLGRQFGEANFHQCLDRLMDEIVRHRSPGSWLGTPSYRPGPVIHETGPWDPDAAAAVIASFFDDLYRNLPGAADATHWIDDTPFNILHASELSAVFPAMRLVHVHRHPLDVAAAYRKQRWGGDDIAVIAERLAGVFRKWFAVRGQLDADHFIEIGLEDLLDDPKGTLAGVLAAVGADTDDGVMTAPALERDRANVGRWRRDLSADEAALCRQRLRFMMEAYGYE